MTDNTWLGCVLSEILSGGFARPSKTSWESSLISVQLLFQGDPVQAFGIPSLCSLLGRRYFSVGLAIILVSTDILATVCVPEPSAPLRPEPGRISVLFMANSCQVVAGSAPELRLIFINTVLEFHSGIKYPIKDRSFFFSHAPTFMLLLL